jgi:hypothetical protein
VTTSLPLRTGRRRRIVVVSLITVPSIVFHFVLKPWISRIIVVFAIRIGIFFALFFRSGWYFGSDSITTTRPIPFLSQFYETGPVVLMIVSHLVID